MIDDPHAELHSGHEDDAGIQTFRLIARSVLFRPSLVGISDNIPYISHNCFLQTN